MPTPRKWLRPLGALYGFFADRHHQAYDQGRKRIARFDLPVVSVGNLTVGGTGKTPHIEYLLRLLQGKGLQVGVLSRGYGRRSKGFVLASPESTPQQIGDEPCQFARKFPQAAVAVGEERALAIPQLLGERPELQVLLLDDAYQHRPVARDLNLLLTDMRRPFYADEPMPAGWLREGRKGALRADAVVVSKCPADLPAEKQQKIQQQIAAYTRPGTPVFFSTFAYGDWQPLLGEGPSRKPKAEKIVLLTGLAHTAGLEADLADQHQVVAHLRLPDHHAYSLHDLRKLLDLWQQHAGPDTVLLTTEKDMVKLQAPRFRPLLEGLPFYYVPIEVRFLPGSPFDDFVQQALPLST